MEFRAPPSSRRKNCSEDCRYSHSSVPSPREAEILAMVALGWTNEHVAHSLGISAKTVKSHLEHAYVKLEAANRAQAVAVAITRGYITYE